MVALILIVLVAAIGAGVYYYYTEYVDVVNVRLSISLGEGVPVTIPSEGVMVESALLSSCSMSTSGTTALCQIKMPNGGAASAVQVQLDFTSAGCAFPNPVVDSGNLSISQNFSEPNTYCNSPGIASYYFILTSGSTGYRFPLSPQTAVAGITFTSSSAGG